MQFNGPGHMEAGMQLAISNRAHSHFPAIIIAFYESDFQANGVRFVLLALSTTACVNAKTTDNANNASLTPMTNEASDRENGNALYRICMQCHIAIHYFGINQINRLFPNADAESLIIIR